VFSSNSQTPVFSSNSQTPVFSSNSQTPVFSSNSQTPVFSSNSQTPVFSPNSQTPVFSSNSQTPVFSSNSQTPVFSSNSQTPVFSSISQLPLSTTQSNFSACPFNISNSQPNFLFNDPISQYNLSTLSFNTGLQSDLSNPQQPVQNGSFLHLQSQPFIQTPSSFSLPNNQPALQNSQPLPSPQYENNGVFTPHIEKPNFLQQQHVQQDFKYYQSYPQKLEVRPKMLNFIFVVYVFIKYLVKLRKLLFLFFFLLFLTLM
jgi:hypothetical protein